MIKKFIISSLVLFAAYTLPAFSQDEEECIEGTEEYDMDPYCQQDPDDEVPLDGGVTFLIGTGMAYGVRRIRKNKTYHK